MVAKVDLEVKHLREVQREAARKIAALHGAPMLEAMRDAAIMVMRDAQIKAPADRGHLRASITPDVEQDGNTVMGIVGSNKEYAPPMELGATFPNKMPPVSALEVWARRHGIKNVFALCRSIARKGLRPRRFLQGAFEKNKDRIMRRIERGVREAIK